MSRLYATMDSDTRKKAATTRGNNEIRMEYFYGTRESSHRAGITRLIHNPETRTYALEIFDGENNLLSTVPLPWNEETQKPE